MSRLALIVLVTFIAACSSKQTPPQAAPAPVAEPVPATSSAGSATTAQLIQDTQKKADAILAKVQDLKSPRNFICERLAAENPKAGCEPEYTDVGDLHEHTARITVNGGQMVCAVNTQQPVAVCGPQFFVPKQEQAPQADQPKTEPKKK